MGRFWWCRRRTGRCRRRASTSCWRAGGRVSESDGEVAVWGRRATVKTVGPGVEMFRKRQDEGQAGDNVGVLLRGTKREEVERGQVLAKPGSITPHTHFECAVYVL